MQRTHRPTASMLVCGLLLSMAASKGAAAQDPAEFFKSRSFNIVVGSPPAGSYDFYARSIARHIGRHLPGQPSVVVQNMPGGGGYEAANHLYNTAAKDGSVIATFSRGVPMQPLTDKGGVRFEPQKLEWIGSPSSEVSLGLAWHTSPIKTFEDVRRGGMTVGSTGPATDTNVFARILSNMLGLKIKQVSGYRGAADILLAMERGEVDGAFGVSWASLWSQRKDWVETGKLSFLVQLALQTGPPQISKAPLVTDLEPRSTIHGGVRDDAPGDAQTHRPPA